ncbi:MAG: zinc ribbon domain-containing protein [Candidatus Aminicenantales bacterium]
MEEKKRAIYSALKELEFDFKMGKLTEEDYYKLKSRYEREAIDVLKQLDRSSLSVEGLEEKVEKEISSYLEKKRDKVQKNFCPNCGSEVRIQDSFCSNCGTKLRRENS